jgi:hypothetical protein
MRYNLDDSNRPSPPQFIESIATELVKTEDEGRLVIKQWSGHGAGKEPTLADLVENEEPAEKPKYEFDKETGQWVLHRPELTDGYGGDSDTNASSQWSLESMRSIKEEGETYSEFYARIGVFLGVGRYCWHRAVDEGADMRYQLKYLVRRNRITSLPWPAPTVLPASSSA